MPPDWHCLVSASSRTIIRFLFSLSNAGKKCREQKVVREQLIVGRAITVVISRSVISIRVSCNILVPHLPHSFIVFNSFIEIAINERFCREGEELHFYRGKSRSCVFLDHSLHRVFDYSKCSDDSSLEFP